MNIIEIVVSAGRTFNHPQERFSNFKQSVSLKATLVDGELYEHAVVKLQDSAEAFAENLKERTLKALDKLRSLEDAKRQLEIEIDIIKNPNELPF